MRWISPEQRDEILEKTDIVDVIGKYVDLKRTGSGYMGLCPFHSEKTPSFSVDPRRQMYKCFGCNAAGNVITFLMEYENMEYVEALEYLAENAGITLSENSSSGKGKAGKEKQDREILLDINKNAALYFFRVLKSPEGKKGYEYLSGRKLSDSTIVHFGLGYSGMSGEGLYKFLKEKGFDDRHIEMSGLFRFEKERAIPRFWNRVMFPILDMRNHVIGFGGRVMSDAKPKYLNSSENIVFSKRKNLYGLNFAKSAGKKYMILCEGYMDVIALHQAGFSFAVASLGTAFTDEQAVLLKRFTDTVLLTYDSDEAGHRAALRAIPMLRDAGIDAKVINMQPYKDPDEFIKALGADEFQKRIDSAENGFRFQIRLLEEKYDMTDPDQLSRFHHDIAGVIAEIHDPLKSEAYEKTASADYSVDLNDLRSEVMRIRQKNSGMRRERKESESRAEKKTLTGKDGISQSYALLLSWIMKCPEDFKLIRKWVDVSDFPEGYFRDLAGKVYSQAEKKKTDPSGITAAYEDADMQQKTADILQMDMKYKIENEDRLKALSELVLGIRKKSLEEKISRTSDMNEFKKLVETKKRLNNVSVIS